VLLDMERLAAERDFPIVGPLVGRMISLLAQSIGAKRILELGSGYGYSGYWFARALPPDGELILTR
jgi:predicted O-methyltransferase YrrM